MIIYVHVLEGVFLTISRAVALTRWRRQMEVSKNLPSKTSTYTKYHAKGGKLRIRPLASKICTKTNRIHTVNGQGCNQFLRMDSSLVNLNKGWFRRANTSQISPFKRSMCGR